MDVEAEGRALAAELGLEFLHLTLEETARAAVLEQHGLDLGQEDRLPPEARQALAVLDNVIGKKAASLPGGLGLAGRLFLATGARPGFLVRGTYQGFHASIYPARGSQGAGRGVSLRFRRPLGFDLRICREGLGHKLGKLLRLTQDLQVADPVLDPLVLIQAEDASAAQAWLADPALREELALLFRLSEGIEVLRWGLRYRTDNDAPLIPERVREILDVMCPVATFGPGAA